MMPSEIKFDSNQQFFIQYYPKNEGNIRIVAGAGSGKTETICEMAKTIFEKESSSKICMITFTKKAAEELLDRMKKKLSKSEDQIKDSFTIGTIHKVMKDLKKLNDSKNTSSEKMEDEVKLKSYSAELVKSYNLFDFSESYSSLYDKISYLKNKGKTETEIIESLTKAYKHYHKNNQNEEEKDIESNLKNYFKEYNSYKKEKKGIIDFDDMLNLEGIDEEDLKNRFDYIFIDEFQDVNQLQYNLFKKFRGEKTKFIMIGDDDQAIYGFRGSDPQLFQLIEKEEFKAISPTHDGREIQLSINYRSDYKSTIEIARKVIENNKQRIPKNIVSKKQEEETNDRGYDIINCLDEEYTKNEYFEFEEEEKEEFISVYDRQKMEASKICEIIKNNQASQGKIYRPYTLLYRFNYQIWGIMDLFIKKDIPFVLNVKEDDFMGIYHLFYFKETWLIIYHLIKEKETLKRDELVRNLGFHIYLSEKDIEKIIEKIDEDKEKRFCNYLDSFFEKYKEKKQSNDTEKQSIDEELINIQKYIQILQEIYNDGDRSSLCMYELISTMMELPRYRNVSKSKDIMNNQDTFKGEYSDFLKTYFQDKTFAEAKMEYEARKKNFEENKKNLKKYKKDYYDAINIMTIHKSKGLTFENVILVGNNENQFPAKNVIDDEELNDEVKLEIEMAQCYGRSLILLSEERRLMYVALTRAKNKTYLLYSGKASKFIEEIQK